MVDNFVSYLAGLDAPAQNAATLTPSDSTDLAVTTRFLYVGVTGDVTCILAGDSSTVLFKAVPVGLHRLRVKRLYATGTTATNMLGLS